MYKSLFDTKCQKFSWLRILNVTFQNQMLLMLEILYLKHKYLQIYAIRIRFPEAKTRTRDFVTYE